MVSFHSVDLFPPVCSARILIKIGSKQRYSYIMQFFPSVTFCCGCGLIPGKIPHLIMKAKHNHIIAMPRRVPCRYIITFYWLLCVLAEFCSSLFFVIVHSRISFLLWYLLCSKLLLAVAFKILVNYFVVKFVIFCRGEVVCNVSLLEALVAPCERLYGNIMVWSPDFAATSRPPRLMVGTRILDLRNLFCCRKPDESSGWNARYVKGRNLISFARRTSFAEILRLWSASFNISTGALYYYKEELKSVDGTRLFCGTSILFQLACSTVSSTHDLRSSIIHHACDSLQNLFLVVLYLGGTYMWLQRLVFFLRMYYLRSARDRPRNMVINS